MTRSPRATVNTYLGIEEPVAPLWGRRGSHIMYTRGQIGRLSSARPIVPKGSLGTCACTHSLRTLNSNHHHHHDHNAFAYIDGLPVWILRPWSYIINVLAHQ